MPKKSSCLANRPLGRVENNRRRKAHEALHKLLAQVKTGLFHRYHYTPYIDREGLPKRHDYDVDISGGTPAAHYFGEYQEAGGIMFPTKHDIFPRQPDNTPNRELLVVSIGLSNFDLK
jgi:hypothetical protein